MRRREFIELMGGTALLLAAQIRRAHAQQPGAPVIGFLNSESPGPLAQLIATFHQGLNEIGYVEGKNVTVEYRWAKGQYARLRDMAADLVSRRVAVIVATGASPSLLAARSATREIPTVLINGEPMQDGIVVSFNRPSRNATGVSLFSDMLSEKRLKLVRELVPSAAVIGLLVDPNSKESVIESSEVQEAADAIGQRIIVFKAASERDLDSAFASIVPQQPAAVLIAGSPFFTRQRDQLVSLAARYAIPTVYEWRDFATAGGLISYGPSLTDAYRQVGVYAARILNGDRPSDLPVQQLDRFELVINITTAKALGLEIPPTLLARADEVIE
jgi:putative tryptophan/tyrosine transport system substrate-binding protein